MVYTHCKLTNRVPGTKQGKAAKIGQTPYEVAVLDSLVWENLCDTQEEASAYKVASKGVLARFNTYGDAYAYAVRLKESQQYYAVLLFTKTSILTGLAD